MAAREERVRFCDQCNSVVGWYAEICEECGGRIGGGNGKATAVAAAPAAPAAPAVVEKDLFKAHLRLIHRFKEQATHLGRAADRAEAALEDLAGKSPTPETRRSLLGFSERLLELEQEWEDLQRNYNTQSESIEEEFLDRIPDLEADIELSHEHQNAIESEVRSFLELLETLDRRQREIGRKLDVAIARHRSRVFGLSTSPRGTIVLGVLALAFAAAGAAHGILVSGLPPRELAIALIPAWAGICALFLNARAKSI